MSFTPINPSNAAFWSSSQNGIPQASNGAVHQDSEAAEYGAVLGFNGNNHEYHTIAPRANEHVDDSSRRPPATADPFPQLESHRNAPTQVATPRNFTSHAPYLDPFSIAPWNLPGGIEAAIRRLAYDSPSSDGGIPERIQAEFKRHRGSIDNLIRESPPFALDDESDTAQIYRLEQHVDFRGLDLTWSEGLTFLFYKLLQAKIQRLNVILRDEMRPKDERLGLIRQLDLEETDAMYHEIIYFTRNQVQSRINWYFCKAHIERLEEFDFKENDITLQELDKQIRRHRQPPPAETPSTPGSPESQDTSSSSATIFVDDFLNTSAFNENNGYVETGYLRLPPNFSNDINQILDGIDAGHDAVLLRDLDMPQPSNRSQLARCIRFAKSHSQREVNWRSAMKHAQIIFRLSNAYGRELLRGREFHTSGDDKDLRRAVRFARRPDQMGRDWTAVDIKGIVAYLCAMED